MQVERALQIDEVAARQRGHVTRRQLVTAGMSRATVRRRASSGLLVPVGRQTFRLASVAPSWEGRVVAACLDHDAVASHWTAAALHGFTARRTLIDVTVRRRGPGGGATRPCPAWPSVRVHSSTNLPEADLVRVQDVPATSVARTALGLAALVPAELSQAALFDTVSAAVDLRLARDPWLWWLLTERRCRGRNGVTALESVLAERARLGPTESWLEREVLRVLEQAGVARPETQRVVRQQGRFAARVDFVYDAERIVVEALGYAHHRSAEQLATDLERANRLQLLGFIVLPFTTQQVVVDPARVVSTIHEALADARLRSAA